MKKTPKEILISAVLIVTLSNEIPDSILHSELGKKFNLQPAKELSLSGDLQVHIAEIPNEQRLIWPTVAAHSGIRFLSQEKSYYYQVPY